jgi:hypothetical protein
LQVPGSLRPSTQSLPPHRPRPTRPARRQDAGGGKSLLAALQARSRVRPALLTAEVVLAGEAAAVAAAAGAAVPLANGGAAAAALAAPAAAPTSGDKKEQEDDAVLQLVLWRADALTAVIELDKNLGVVRADAAAGMLFGINSKAMLKKDFRK